MYAMLIYDNSDALLDGKLFFDTSLTGMNLLSLFLVDAFNAKALLHGITSR